MTAAAYPGEVRVTTGRNRGTMYGLVGAGQKIPAGAFIAIIGGYWVNVTSITGLEGRYAVCLRDVDNTGGLDGAKVIEVQILGNRNLEIVANDTGSPITQSDLGDEFYWLDNATATSDGTGRSVGGRSWAFYQASASAPDQTRVWVEVY